MISEYTYFFRILNDHLHGKKTRIIDSINIEEVKKIAKMHQLEPIVYIQTGMRELKSKYLFQLYYYMNQKKILTEIHEAISQVEYFIFKGSIIAELYPIPELRTMSDMDILVHKNDQEFVHRKLIQLGYNNTIKENEEVWHYRKGVFEIELHNQLIYSNTYQNEYLVEFCKSCWDYYANYTIDWNFHLLYLVIHLRKHFVRGGIGIRQFYDIAIICNIKELDWQWIEKKANDIGLLDFLKTILSFNEKWFGVKSGLDTVFINEQFYEESTIRIIQNGVFGNADVYNLAYRAVYEIKKRGYVHYFFHTIFWPYSKLINDAEYKFLQGRKYLLPFAWGKRLALKVKDYFRYRDYHLFEKSKFDFFDNWGL